MLFRTQRAEATQGARRLTLLVSLLVLLGACAAPPTATTQAPKPPLTKAQQSEQVVRSEEAVVVDGPAAKPPVDVRRLIDSARGHLNQGNEDEAQSELNQVLEAEPDNKLALHYLRQIKEDPVARYGRASQAYRVERGDTMASLAARHLGDATQFYGLARYAGVKAPGDLKVGQVVKLPARRVGSDAGTATPPPPSTGTVDETRAKAEAEAKRREEEQKEAEAKKTADERKAAERKKGEIEALVKKGNTATAGQNLCGAIKIWTQVLELDPQHSAAKYERDRAMKMQAALPARKC